MKPFVLLTTLFLTAQVMGQPMQKVKRLLKNRDLASLENFLENTAPKNITVHAEYMREIIPGYLEAMITIEDLEPANDRRGGNIIYNYRLNVLAKGNKLFYYTLSGVHYGEGDGESDPHYEKTDSFRNIRTYTDFENAFRQVYGESLAHNDLFITSIVYGSSCGYAGVDPEYMERLNTALADKRADIPRQWLKSPNAEKQLYAIRGYRYLISQGYQPTTEENRLLKMVRQKKGTVSTCGGCMYMNETFGEVVDQIDTMPAEYLSPQKHERTAPVAAVYPAKENKKNNPAVWYVLPYALAAAGLSIVWWLQRRARQHRA